MAKPSSVANGGKKYVLKHGGASAVMTNDAVHFATAQTQYNTLCQGNAKKVTQVDYYYNPAVQQQYDACVQKFKQAGKDASPIWIFHGTSAAVVPKIMESGFLVGGAGTAVTNGSAYGIGVYSATGPGTPMGYAQGANMVILAMALKGKHATASSAVAGNDSWTPQADWMIFAKSEQLHPIYVVHYQ